MKNTHWISTSIQRAAFILFTLATVAAGPWSTAWAQAGCGIPARTPASSWSSDQFYRANPNPGSAREYAVVSQVLSGNVPSGLRNLQTIAIDAVVDRQQAKVEIEVAPDYLTIGTESDFVRTPMTSYAAQYAASQMGFVLPTKRMVDAIYDWAQVKLNPQPTDWYKSGSAMRFGPNYLVHSGMIESQRRNRMGLAAGHKKDVVNSNRLDSAPGRVAIYGWQQSGNRPIQSLSTVHDLAYDDYSHGIRLIGPFARVRYQNGRVVTMTISQALRDPQVGSALNSGEGALRDVRAARQCPADFARAVGLTPQTCPPQPRDCSGR